MSNHTDPMFPMPDEFDRFWSVYPRKVGKAAARRAWDKATAHATPTDLADAAVRYASDPNLPEPVFVPHPATWLNQHRWLDGPLPARAGVNQHRRPGALADDRTAPTGAVTEGEW